MIECYAVNALFTVLAIFLLNRHAITGQDRWLLWLCAVVGLAAFNHVQLGFLGLGAGAALITVAIGRRRLPLQLWGRCVLAFLAGFLPWLVTFAFDWVNSGSFMMTLRAAFVGSFESIMLKGSLSAGLREFGFLVVQQTPNLFLPLIPAGLGLAAWRLRREPLLWALLTILLINTWFFLFYNTWDRFAFLLPSFIILIFFGSFALAEVVRWALAGSRTRRTLFLGGWIVSLIVPFWLYAQLSRWGSTPGSWFVARFNNIHTHNTHRVNEYIANPNKRSFTDIEDFARLLAARLPARAIFIDDDSRTYYPLEFYQRYEGLRSDVTFVLLNSWGFDNWGASAQEFSALLNRAVGADIDLFLVSLLHPFHGFLAQGAEHGHRFEFERFPLDERRWVFRLKTRRDLVAPVEAPALPILSSSTLAAGVDLHSRDILIYRDAALVDQEMAGFGEGWGEADHLFVRFGRIGGSIELLTEFPAPATGTLKLTLTTAPDFSRIRVLVNDTVAGEADLYTDTVTLRQLELPVEMPAGRTRITVIAAGPNPHSTELRMGIDRITFVPR